jgi:23S rRNA (guanosine2251-2'-O)-methyltransferase
MEDTYIYGRNAVIDALTAGREIEKIFISFGSEGGPIAKIYAAAKRDKIPCVSVDRKKFAQLERTVCPGEIKSQGVIALLRAFELLSLDELIARAFEKDDRPVLVMLDEISDPHNLGAIARSAECSGAAGIIVTSKNSAPITPVAVKISAGALGRLPVARITSPAQAFERLKNEGFWVIGTDMNAEKLYSDNNYDIPVTIVIGSEGEGMRPGTKKHCDFNIRIPLRGETESLNASVSAGIILFEIVRQRMI